jgi:hypothetical protein
MKKPVGHPVTRWTPEYLELIRSQLDAYRKATPIPCLKDFCDGHDIHCPRLYEHEELSEAIKLCVQKREVGLEKQGLSGASVTFCIFALKQLGWKDTHSIETTFPYGITVKYE